MLPLAQHPSSRRPIPGLLGAALRAYSAAMAAELDRAGLDDMPRTGYRVVGSLARGGSSLRDIAGRLGMSKQAVGQLVDALVARDYCLRLPDPQDRRRVVLRLSDRGWAAARAIRDAVSSVDRMLAGQVSSQDMATARQVLTALAELGRAAGRRDPSVPAWPQQAEA
jgi:DNA-binding MarR family transcriptional regulator